MQGHNVHVAFTCELNLVSQSKGKAIPVTGRASTQGCETSRFPHFLENRLTDGGEVVSLTPRLSFIPRKILGTPVLEVE
jgi:hypothetical protein